MGRSADTHVEHQCSGKPSNCGIIEARRGFVFPFMSRHESDGRRLLALGNGDFGISRGGQPSRHAGYNLQRYCSGTQRGHFFAKTPKHGRIAALQPDNRFSSLRFVYHSLVDRLASSVMPEVISAPRSREHGPEVLG